MSEKTILVLGGGIGGIVAANKLRRLLSRRHNVVVVDREAEFTLAASFLWVMSGERRPDQISKPLSALKRKGIEVLQGEIEQIDPIRRLAVVSGKTIQADYLVIALGARFAPEAVHGLEEYGNTFCTLDGAVKLRDALAEVRSGRILVLTAAPAYKCPAAPYEAAMLIDDLLRKKGLRKSVEVELHSAEPGPMGVAGPEVSNAVKAMVERKGIAYCPSHQIERADGRKVVFTDGVEREFDLMVYVPPIRPPVALSSSGLTDESGWVPVDRHTLATGFENVYAVGDVTIIPLTMGKPLPRAGVFAHGQAEVVANSIARAIRGKGVERKYNGHGACFIEIGSGKAGFGAGNFYADPLPAVKMKNPGWYWHAAKVLFEKQVMWQWL